MNIGDILGTLGKTLIGGVGGGGIPSGPIPSLGMPTLGDSIGGNLGFLLKLLSGHGHGQGTPTGETQVPVGGQQNPLAQLLPMLMKQGGGGNMLGQLGGMFN